MPNFYTKNNRPSQSYTCAGDPIIEDLVRDVSFDANGNPEISYKKVGERNIKEEIQAANHNISVYESIERAIKGDPLALNPSARPDWTQSDAKVVHDLTAAPSSIHEAAAVQAKASALFASLPPEARELYGNSPERMLAEFNADTFNQIMTSIYKKKGDQSNEPEHE